MALGFDMSFEKNIVTGLQYASAVKDILLEIGFIEEMRTTRGNKELPQSFFTIPRIRENTFKSVGLRTIGNPAFRNFVILISKTHRTTYDA